MSVMVETSYGDIVIDLLVDDAPLASQNFLKLCKCKYYNNNLFHTVERDFVVQTGDPEGTGKGGSSIWGLIEGPGKRFFKDQIHPALKHNQIGTVSVHNLGPHLNNSAFFITTASDLTRLDGKHTIFGYVIEGLEVLTKINNCITDDAGHPIQPIRIKHVVVLDDPFDDPSGMERIMPTASPAPINDDVINEDDGLTEQERIDKQEAKTAKSRAEVLEMIGDIPDAEMSPPENVLFVCKLNPVTEEDDLELIFSQFGKVLSCEVIRDWKTGDSLQYAFIEFESKESCERAYFKMDNVLIDDRRVHVNFCQSIPLKQRKEFAEAMIKNEQHGKKNLRRFAHVGNVRSIRAIEGNDPQVGGGKKRYDMVFDPTLADIASGEEKKRKRSEERDKTSHHKDSKRDSSDHRNHKPPHRHQHDDRDRNHSSRRDDRDHRRDYDRDKTYRRDDDRDKHHRKDSDRSRDYRRDDDRDKKQRR